MSIAEAPFIACVPACTESERLIAAALLVATAPSESADCVVVATEPASCATCTSCATVCEPIPALRAPSCTDAWAATARSAETAVAPAA